MPVKGPILIFFADGFQERAVLRTPRQRGHLACALARNQPSNNKADSVVGNLDDYASPVASAQGCMHAVIQVAIGAETIMGRRAELTLMALCHAGARSIVPNLTSGSRPAPCMEPVLVANAAIEALVRRSGILITSYNRPLVLI